MQPIKRPSCELLQSYAIATHNKYLAVQAATYKALQISVPDIVREIL